MRTTRALAALAAVAILSASAPHARAAALWYDFDHDANLSTIQPRTVSGVDSVSLVLDVTGLTLTAPFTFTVSVQRNNACFFNSTTECNGTAIDLLPGSVTSRADSSWAVRFTDVCDPVRIEVGLRFTSVPPPGPFVAAKLLLSYPTENPVCSSSNTVSFDPALVGSTRVGPSYSVKIHDLNVPVTAPTWGRLRRLYR